jgi:hypothetical protein
MPSEKEIEEEYDPIFFDIGYKYNSFDIKFEKVGNKKSVAYYKDENGDKRTIFFEAPTQKVNGINYIYSNKIIKGLRISYPINSIETISNPTLEEQYFKKFIDDIWNAAENHIKTIEVENNTIPFEIRKLFFDKRSIQPSFQKNNINNQEFFNTKLITSGKENKIRVQTQIYENDDDNPISALNLINKAGIGLYTPCFKLDGIYYEIHHNTNYCAHIEYKLAEAFYKLI